MPVTIEQYDNLHNLCVLYFSIKQQIEQAKEPPTSRRFIDRFLTQHGITVTETEFVELRDFAENDFKYDFPDMRGEEVK